MNTVLLVDKDKPWLALCEEYLNVHMSHIKTLSATDNKAACDVINSQRVDLVIIDLRIAKMDGCEHLFQLNTNHPEVGVVLVSALAESDVRDYLNGNYNFRYLQKPLPPQKLAEEIDKYFKEGSRGYVEGFTLANFLQLVELEQKTCTLIVKSNDKIGYLYIKDGELIEAETNGYSGQEAAVQIIGWESAHTKIERFQEKIRTINEPIMRLLLDATSLCDENREALDLENMLGEAINLAECRHFKQARLLLVTLLKKNPRNHLGWLWYARISENMKSIRTGLSYAAKLAPDDPEVAEEINKLDSVKGGDRCRKIKHCPICWCPIQPDALQCHYCAAHLRLYPQVFTSSGAQKEDIIDQAAERFRRVVAREKNAEAQYYLAVIRLNQKKWEEALQHLDTAVKLAPNNPFYSKQLGILLHHMASSEKGTEPSSSASPIGNGHDDSAPQGAERRTILVVEDSPTTRKVIAVTLGRQGYGIVEAGDGLEALSKLNDIRPDLVLLDIILPKMDGYKILSIIKSNPDLRNIPVVMLTSKDSILNKVKGKVSGCEAYLTKPFYPNTLVNTVEKLIAQCK